MADVEEGGTPPSGGFILIYNIYLQIKLAGRSGFLLVLHNAPIANFVVVVDVARAFGKDRLDRFFLLVSSRHEHSSLILTSNLPFSGWGAVFGDPAVAAAMIDRIVHYADVFTLKGASYRLRRRGIDSLPSIKTQEPAN